MADTSKLGLITEAIAAALAADATLPELTADNVIVRKTSFLAVDEEIDAAGAKCAGIAVAIYDMGGDTRDADNSDSPIVDGELAAELYIDPLKHDITLNASLRSADAIREGIMAALHNLEVATPTQDQYERIRVTGYRPLEDPEFAAWRITARRRIIA